MLNFLGKFWVFYKWGSEIQLLVKASSISAMGHWIDPSWWTHWATSRSSQYSTTCKKAVACTILPMHLLCSWTKSECHWAIELVFCYPASSTATVVDTGLLSASLDKTNCFSFRYDVCWISGVWCCSFACRGLWDRLGLAWVLSSFCCLLSSLHSLHCQCRPYVQTEKSREVSRTLFS